MREIEKIEALRRWRKSLPADCTVALVPTMGHFHRGHLSLMQRARGENDLLVVSIFVNPIQFDDERDYHRYPRDQRRDLELARQEGVDVVFAPDNSDLYPEGYCSYVQVEGMTDCLCGASRPGHFRGVTTVVSKLFNVVRPGRAYFGKKDYQQYLVIQRMTRDLSFDTEVVGCPTVREADGLAMSSRNQHLSAGQRESALALYRALKRGRAMVEEGSRDPEEIEIAMRQVVGEHTEVEIDYLQARDAGDLSRPKRLRRCVLLAGAIYVSSTRLIDNIVVQVGEPQEGV